MKKQTHYFALLMLFATNNFAKTSLGSDPDPKLQITGIRFIENKGQVHDQNYKPRPDVLYGAMAGNMALHIKTSGISYQLYKSPSPTLARGERASSDHFFVKAPFSPGEGRGDEATIYRIDLTWLNANTNFTRSEDEALTGYDNYYLENCPEGALNVKSYRGITLKNLYKGIDLHYYEKNGDLKHDYIVAPYADYKQIQLKVDGAEISVNPDGSLMLTSPLGKVQEGAPFVYQNGKQLKAEWQIKNNILSFQVENYDPNFELLIDPVTRLWGTYYGGTGLGTTGEYGSGCATDASGNVYMTGGSDSGIGTIIATVGSHQSVFGGNDDAFLVKFNSSGIRQWATYYGGTGNERDADCATESFGNVYLSGTSSSTDNVIATPGSHQATGGGAFLVKFNSNGVRQWGTYYGGAQGAVSRSCATDASRNVYLTGETDTPTTSTVIATTGSHQPAKSTGYDAYLVKFNGSGVRQWGTYYGGIGNDRGWSCATDTTGNVYMTGETRSPTTTANATAIATAGSHQSAGGGTILDQDAFLVKFDSNGNRQWGTYYGGSLYDWGYDCATDASGNVYLAGGTVSSNGTVIATPVSHQPVSGGGTATSGISQEAFLVKFNSNGIRQWGTYYGGPDDEIGYSCTTDASGNVYFAGATSSNAGTIIATPGSHQPVFGGSVNYYDGYLVKFNTNGVRQSATYYGGTGNDWGYSLAVDAADNVYMTGMTDSPTSTAIATPGSHQPVIGGGKDAFLVKFACTVPPQPAAISGKTIICSSWGANTYSIATIIGVTSYTWSLPAGWSGSGNTNTISATPGISGVFTVTAKNACGASPQQMLAVTVSPCTGLSENTIDSKIKIYPNPNKGTFELELNSDNEVTILNATGQIVYATKLNAGRHQINLENLAKGIYIVKVGNTKGSRNIKMIKE